MTDNSIEQSAAEWAVRMASGPLSAALQEQLDAWLAVDRRHLGALVRARAQWSDFDRLGAVAQPEQPQSSAVEDWAAAGSFNWSRRGLLAASLGALGLAGLGWSAWAPAGERYVTGIGEVRRIPLRDGSTLVLNTDSEARVHFVEKLRKVHLLRGEALFEVAHDADRPFLVTTSRWEVRAIGTVFDVRVRGAEVDVTVSEGAVELAHSDAPEANPQRIAANEHTLLAPAAPIRVQKIPVATVERRFAWLNGMVAFSGETLDEAVAEINRHNRQQLVIDDRELATQPVVGAFKATDPHGFAAAAAAALGAQAIQQGDSLHLRSPRS